MSPARGYATNWSLVVEIVLNSEMDYSIDEVAIAVADRHWDPDGRVFRPLDNQRWQGCTVEELDVVVNLGGATWTRHVRPVTTLEVKP